MGEQRMKMRTIKLTPKLLLEALRGKPSSFISNLPDDIELLDIKYDLNLNQILAIVRSDNFEDIGESRPIPEFNIKHGAIAETVLQPAAIAKPEPKPIMKVQKTKSNQNTTMLEEEFTQDQRKLLSFKVEGDFVIVKPIQYLKAEWNEINEVARSLGGRWVKGDIISYWEIPLKQT